MLKSRWARILATVGIACIFGGLLGATPTIRQKFWIVLGPIQNSGDFWGEIGDPNPTPGHDLLEEFPKAGDDWGGGAIPFISGAPTQWLDLAFERLGQGAPEWQCICWDLIYRRDQGFVLGIDRAKAVAVTYVENRTGSPAEIQICADTYNESMKVWINRDLATNLNISQLPNSSCRTLDPAILSPGKNKITVVSYNGTHGWSTGIRLLKAGGTIIDDESDPSFSFSKDPEGCVRPPAVSVRTISQQCSAGGTPVTIRGPGGGDPAGLVHVFEKVDGTAAVTGISHGGTLVPISRDSSCSGGLQSAGLFADARDIGGPCTAGSTTFDPAGGAYTMQGAGNDIWNGGDQFQFAYLKARGNFSISARIAFRSFDPGPGQTLPPARYGQFGLMARQDCTGASRYSAILDLSTNVDGTDPDAYGFKGRTVHGAAGSSFYIDGAGGIKHPKYVRLDREGNKLIGYASMDAASWVKVGEHVWGDDAPCELLLGLAVCSRAGCPQIEIR